MLNLNKTKILAGFLVVLIAMVFVFAPFSVSANSAPGGASATAETTAGGWVENAFVWFLNQILEIAAWGLSMSAWLFDLSINLSIGDFHKYANLPAISNAWMILRDIANLSFIFVILYISIGTILQLSTYNMKSMLMTVIIIALLVNFSLMFTKVIIDASNVFAMEFYDSLTHDPGGNEVALSETIVSKLRLQSIYTSYAPNDSAPIENQLSTSGVTLGLIGGITYVVIAAYTFLSFAIMFLTRTAILLFLLVLSPLAFLGMALPGLKGKSSQWWQTLFAQALFAPACLFLVYVSVGIMSSGNLMTLAKVNSDSGLLGFLFEETGAGTIGILIYFALIITFLKASLKIAQSMATTGSQGLYATGDKLRDWAWGMAKRPAGAVGKQVLRSPARFARMLAETDRGKKAKDRLEAQAVGGGVAGWIGRQKLNLYKGAQKAGGLGEAQDKAIERHLSFINSVSPENGVKYFSNLSSRDQKAIFEKRSARERVQMKENKLDSSIYDTLFKKLSAEEMDKTAKAEGEVMARNAVKKLALVAKTKDNGSTQEATSLEDFEDVLNHPKTKIKPDDALKLAVLFDINAEDSKLTGDALEKEKELRKKKAKLLIRKFGAKHFKKIGEEGDKITEDFFRYLKEALIEGNNNATFEEITSELLKDDDTHKPNRNLVSWLKANQTKTLIDSYLEGGGPSSSKEKSKKFEDIELGPGELKEKSKKFEDIELGPGELKEKGKEEKTN